MLKFGFSEKATKFEKIFVVLLTRASCSVRTTAYLSKSRRNFFFKCGQVVLCKLYHCATEKWKLQCFALLLKSITTHMIFMSRILFTSFVLITWINLINEVCTSFSKMTLCNVCHLLAKACPWQNKEERNFGNFVGNRCNSPLVLQECGPKSF